MVENKLINIDWLISKIEYELSQSTTSSYNCTDGTVIKTDVGYVEEWWNEYKQHLIQQLTDNSKPMTKIYCGNVCQYRIGEVCGRETVNITSYGCHSYKCVSREKESITWSTNPWENYTPPSELVEEYRKRSRLLSKEDKISKDDVNQES